MIKKLTLLLGLALMAVGVPAQSTLNIIYGTNVVINTTNVGGTNINMMISATGTGGTTSGAYIANVNGTGSNLVLRTAAGNTTPLSVYGHAEQDTQIFSVWSSTFDMLFGVESTGGITTWTNMNVQGTLTADRIVIDGTGGGVTLPSGGTNTLGETVLTNGVTIGGTRYTNWPTGSAWGTNAPIYWDMVTITNTDRVDLLLSADLDSSSQIYFRSGDVDRYHMGSSPDAWGFDFWEGSNRIWSADTDFQVHTNADFRKDVSIKGTLTVGGQTITNAPTILSATATKSARFDAGRQLVSGTYDETDFALAGSTNSFAKLDATNSTGTAVFGAVATTNISATNIWAASVTASSFSGPATGYGSLSVAGDIVTFTNAALYGRFTNQLTVGTTSITDLSQKQASSITLSNLAGTGALTNASAVQASSMVLSNIVGSGALTNPSAYQASSINLSNWSAITTASKQESNGTLTAIAAVSPTTGALTNNGAGGWGYMPMPTGSSAVNRGYNSIYGYELVSTNTLWTSGLIYVNGTAIASDGILGGATASGTLSIVDASPSNSTLFKVVSSGSPASGYVSMDAASHWWSNKSWMVSIGIACTNTLGTNVGRFGVNGPTGNTGDAYHTMGFYFNQTNAAAAMATNWMAGYFNTAGSPVSADTGIKTDVFTMLSVRSDATNVYWFTNGVLMQSVAHSQIAPPNAPGAHVVASIRAIAPSANLSAFWWSPLEVIWEHNIPQRTVP